MGAWGTAISSNDTYADIYSEFFDLYNDGFNVTEISKKLIDDNQKIIGDTDDSNNFWFALAKAQWECKQLDNNIFNIVKNIIETGADLEIWRQLGANEKDIKNRKAILDKFLVDVKKERLKAKLRKKKVIRQPVFEKGDCLTFKLENKNYGGVVVLEAVKDTEYGYNLIASTRINKLTKPTKKDFENAEVLLLNYESWNDKQNVSWYLPLQYKTIAHLIEIVGNIEVQLSYDINTSMLSVVADFNIWFIEVANKQFKSEQVRQRTKNRCKIKELTKNKSK